MVTAAAIACALAAPDAAAFCRSRTVAVPADYDATQLGCKPDGLPFFWRNSCVGYSIQKDASKRISYGDASNLISEAFTRWTGTTCGADPDTGNTRVSIDVRDLGPVDCAKVEYHGGVANQNVILFRDDSWPYNHEVLGLTHVQYDPQTGEIFGADMELNMYDMDPIYVGDGPLPAQVNGQTPYDFLSVVTHEAGHFLGMAHSDQKQSTMFWSYLPGQTFQRSLQQDDIDGICSIYEPDGSRTVLNTRITAGGQCDPTPRGGYTTECYQAPGCDVAPGSLSTLGDAALIGLVVFGVTRRRVRRRLFSR